MDFGKEAARGSGRWLQKVASTGRQPAPPRMTRGQSAILRFIGPLAVLVIIATIVCTVLGFVLAQRADDYLEVEHRQALRGAIEALKKSLGFLEKIEEQALSQLAEQSMAAIVGARCAVIAASEVDCSPVIAASESA